MKTKVTSRKVFIIVIILLVMGCTSRGDLIASGKFHNSDYSVEAVETIEFIVLPNGTRVDTRVDDEIVDLVFRHFEAIENGDIVAFRETLQAQDSVSLNWHMSLILAHFWDIVVADYREDKLFLMVICGQV